MHNLQERTSTGKSLIYPRDSADVFLPNTQSEERGEITSFLMLMMVIGVGNGRERRDDKGEKSGNGNPESVREGVGVLIMNKKQKYILLLGLFLIALMGLFPPWNFNFEGSVVVRPGPYAFIFSPPTYKIFSVEGAPRIDTFRLLVQWAVVVTLCSGLFFFPGDKE
jgi:hypothetical protein